MTPCDFHRISVTTLVCERCGMDFNPETPTTMTDEHTTSVSNSPSDVKPKPLRDLKPRGIKAPLHLLPAGPLRAIASAFLNGAMIYEPWNWTKETDDYREVFAAAALRHLQSYADPTESDYAGDSGVHHLAGAAASIMILLYHDGIDYHVPNSVAEIDQPIPYTLAAGCECHSAGCPKCQPVTDAPSDLGYTITELPAKQIPRGVKAVLDDLRAQCSAHDRDGMRCLQDDEHEGLHENDQTMWDDGACRQGCP